MNWQAIENAIVTSTLRNFKVLRHYPVSGGSISASYVIEGDVNQYFVKLNTPHCADMFFGEAEGLMALRQADVIRVPAPVCWGVEGHHAYLVMENLTFSSGGRRSAEQFGHQLAALHQTTKTMFGWHRANTIGSTLQNNEEHHCWLTFYREQRLQYQLGLATKNGCERELRILGDKLCDQLGAFFISYQPQPSLLHGDLWSGNYAYDENGNPLFFDPAVYYGDRETDIAMSELFGGFPSDFYLAYNEKFPLNDGYPVRKTLYNLYHVLNHFNLFGGGYQQQTIGMMKKLLSEIS